MDQANQGGQPDRDPADVPSPSLSLAPQATHPPLQPGGISHHEPAVWPNVLGTLAIVFGALGVLQGCIGVAGSFAQGLVPMGAAPGVSEMHAALQAWRPFMVASAIITSALAALLLAAGIGMLRREPWSPRLTRLWAVLKAVFIPVVSVISMSMQRDTMAAVLKGSSTAPPPMMAGFMQTFAGIGLVIGIIWGEAFPIFMLVWLSRAPVRREIAHWPRRDG